MSLGLTNDPATFQRLVNKVLGTIKCIWMISSFTQLTSNSIKIDSLRIAGQPLNPPSALSQRQKLSNLVILYPRRVYKSPDKEKLKEVREYPIPKYLRDVRGFLGFTSYYRRYIYQYSKITATLSLLFRNEEQFWWSLEQEGSFRKLPKKIFIAPILGHFDEEDPIEIDTDASGVGIGALLVQTKNSQERVICYASKGLNRCQEK